MGSPKIDTVAIIGCGKSKLDHAAPACELYTGSLFRAALAHAESTADRVFIASAKHGLLRTTQTIEPYDQKLRRGGVGAFVRDASVDAWRARVSGQLHKLARDLRGPGVLFSIYAGADYSLPIVEAIRFAAIEQAYHVRTPLDGMTLGRRLQWFAAQRQLREGGTTEPIDDAFLARVQAELDSPEADEVTEEEADAMLTRQLTRVARHTGQLDKRATLEALGQRRLFEEVHP